MLAQLSAVCHSKPDMCQDPKKIRDHSNNVTGSLRSLTSNEILLLFLLIYALLNPRPAGVFGRTRPSGEGGGGSFFPPPPNSRTGGRSETGEAAIESSR